MSDTPQRPDLDDRPAADVPLGRLPDGTPITLVQPNGTTRPVLGTRTPEDAERRAQVVAHWRGGSARSPRQPIPAAIEQPLDTRTRSILSHELPPDIAALIEGRR